MGNTNFAVDEPSDFEVSQLAFGPDCARSACHVTQSSTAQLSPLCCIAPGLPGHALSQLYDPTIHRPSSGLCPSAVWPVPLTRLDNKGVVDSVASLPPYS